MGVSKLQEDRCASELFGYRVTHVAVTDAAACIGDARLFKNEIVLRNHVEQRSLIRAGFAAFHALCGANDDWHARLTNASHHRSTARDRRNPDR